METAATATIEAPAPDTVEAALNTMELSAQAMEGCARIYGLLARIYREEVDSALIDQMRGMRFPARTGSEEMDKGNRLIVKYLSNVGAQAVDELAVDYSRTFIGGGIDSFSAAYPYESVHTGRKRLMMQSARDEVLAIYRAYGLDKSGNVKIAEDHIAYELEFLETLCNRCARALRAGDEASAEKLARAQANFLEDHLLNWAGKLTSQMRHFCKTDFYRGTSYLTIGSLKEHRAMLREMLG